MERFKINDRIKIVGKNVKGKVVFVGETHFADGTLYGVAMDDPIGRHDGIMNGVRYFKCKENHGIFVKASQLKNVGNGIEKSRSSKESASKKKSSNNSSQETNEVKPNDARETARKYSPPTYKVRDYAQSGLQRKFKLKPKEKLAAEDQAKNIADLIMKSSAAENGSKPGEYAKSCPPKKFKPKPKERITTEDQNKSMSERKEESKLNDKNFRESKLKEHGSLKEQNNILNNEISYKDGQLATLQSELSRLKSCIHWCRKFSNSTNFKDINLKRFFTQEIDVRIKNMEETIKNSDSKQSHGRFKDYKTLKEHNRFLQLYVVDLEKQTELLMETILRIRGIVLKQRKKRRSDPKGSYKNYLQKHVGKFFKNNGFSSQTFTEDDMAVCSSRVSPSSFDRDLESLAETIPNAGKKDESEAFDPDERNTKQKQMKSSFDKDKSTREKKDNEEKSVVSIPDSEEYVTTKSFPVWRDSSTAPKTNKKPQGRRRYEPYPRNLIHFKEKKPSLVSKNTFKYIPKDLEAISSKLVKASKRLSRSKQNCETSPHLLIKGPRQYEMMNLFGAYKQAKKVPSKPKISNLNIHARGKRSVIRPNPLKRKFVYSTQTPIRK